MELVKIIGYNRRGEAVEKYLPKKFVDTQLKLPVDKRRGFMKTAKTPAEAVQAGSREFNNLITLAGGMDKVKELLAQADNSVENLNNPVEAKAPKAPKTKKVAVTEELKEAINQTETPETDA
jgi:hypothetical protein